MPFTFSSASATQPSQRGVFDVGDGSAARFHSCGRKSSFSCFFFSSSQHRVCWERDYAWFPLIWQSVIVTNVMFMVRKASGRKTTFSFLYWRYSNRHLGFARGGGEVNIYKINGSRANWGSWVTCQHCRCDCVPEVWQSGVAIQDTLSALSYLLQINKCNATK